MNTELRLLLLEDTPSDAELINRELRNCGLHFSSTRVESENDFLYELENHRPDVILSDHGIPAFDGLAALAAARQRCPDVPFIFVTGTPADEAQAEPLQRGADDYVAKNELQQLGPAIRRALQQSREITQRVQRLVRQRTAQVEADHRELLEFVHAMALECRTPLRYIERFAQMLQKGAADLFDPKTRSGLKTVVESAAQIGHVTDEMLAFSRIGRAEMYRLQFSLADMVKEIIQELRRETEGRAIAWHFGDLPEVVGDPALLGEAMSCLISNALKFTRPRKHPRIEIGCTQAPHEMIICVADNGVGFDPRYKDKLFGAFKRLHEAKEFEGLGLGLAKARRIIQRHGGRAWADGSPEKGAKFCFSIPRALAHSKREPEPGD